jgi:hypothetical protein
MEGSLAGEPSSCSADDAYHLRGSRRGPRAAENWAAEVCDWARVARRLGRRCRETLRRPLPAVQRSGWSWAVSCGQAGH